MLRYFLLHTRILPLNEKCNFPNIQSPLNILCDLNVN